MKIENFIKQSPSALLVLGGLSIQQKAKRDLKGMGLNLNFLQATVLAAVYFEQPEAVMVTKIVDSTGLSKSNISQIISHLESEGLIKRKLYAGDQRVWLLTTTKKANLVLPQVVGYFDSIQRKIEKDFSEKELLKFYKISEKAKSSHKE